MKIGPQFIKDLNSALNTRRVARGLAMLDQSEQSWSRLTPNHPHTTEFLLLLAQWIDVGYRDYKLLDPLLRRFPPQSRRKLPMEDYFRLRIVEGFRAFSAEEVDVAIDTFDFVLKAEPESSGDHLDM